MMVCREAVVCDAVISRQQRLKFLCLVLSVASVLVRLLTFVVYLVRRDPDWLIYE